MNESWEEARARCEAALGELVEGKSEAFKERWSRSDLTVIMGAFGGYERGWEHVAQRLDWASKGIRATGRRSENLLTVVGQDSHALLTWNTWSAPSVAVPTTGSFAVPRCTGWRTASGK